MPAQSSQPWARASSFRRRIGYPHPDLRVSDAERSEVADRLAKHYGDGRLDQAEFNERVDQAMKAKTQSDLSGLFDDLPADDESQLPVRRPRRRHDHRLLAVALIVALAIAAGNSLVWPFTPHWALIALLAVAALYVLKPHGERRHDQGGRPGPPPRP